MIRPKRLRAMPRYKPRLDLWNNPNLRITPMEVVVWLLAIFLFSRAATFFLNHGKQVQTPRPALKTGLLKV